MLPLPKEGNKERPGNEVVETRASQLVFYFQISYVYPQTQHSDQSQITGKLQVSSKIIINSTLFICPKNKSWKASIILL